MQQLFAFWQCKKANYNLSIQWISSQFELCDNPSDEPNKEAEKQLAHRLFIESFDDNIIPKSANPVSVTDAVQKALSTCRNRIQVDRKAGLDRLLNEKDKIETLYHQVLYLFSAWWKIALSDKKKRYDNLIKNPCLKGISTLPKIKDAQSLLSDSLVLNSFKNFHTDDLIQHYIDRSHPDEDHNKTILKHLLRAHVLSTHPLSDHFDSIDPEWVEDKSIIKSLVEKTFRSFYDGHIQLQSLSYNWDEDQKFTQELYSKTIELATPHKDLIKKYTRKWDIDRLVLMDRILLEMALTEIVHFPSIPVKVTINEYIELAKKYGSPNSQSFVNGILDAIIKDLDENKEIKKRGKGLLDNKS